jgi:hypothetical protein
MAEARPESGAERVRSGRPGASTRQRLVGPLAGLFAGAAASVFATAVASGVAGYQASRSLRPIEFTLRVGLLVAAPLIGAVLARLALPRRAGPYPSWAIGAGVVVGPLVVLRLDRVVSFGWTAILATAASLAAWGLAGAHLASSAATRGSQPAERTELPPPLREGPPSGGAP